MGVGAARDGVRLQSVNGLLPVAEGFWNNPGLMVRGQLWAIQNVENEQGETVESERKLISFDLQQKAWKVHKVIDKSFRNN